MKSFEHAISDGDLSGEHRLTLASDASDSATVKMLVGVVTIDDDHGCTLLWRVRRGATVKVFGSLAQAVRFYNDGGM